MTRQPGKGPEFVRYFGPLLDALRSLGNSGTPTEVVERISDALKIDETRLNETIPSGQSRIYNQVNWARSYLTREKLLDGSERGVWRLTERGIKTKLSHNEALEVFRRQHAVIQAEREAKQEFSASTP